MSSPAELYKVIWTGTSSSTAHAMPSDSPAGSKVLRSTMTKGGVAEPTGTAQEGEAVAVKEAVKVGLGVRERGTVAVSVAEPLGGEVGEAVRVRVTEPEGVEDAEAVAVRLKDPVEVAMAEGVELGEAV